MTDTNAMELETIPDAGTEDLLDERIAAPVPRIERPLLHGEYQQPEERRH